MSWDEKDWSYLIFWGDSEDIVRKAASEYDKVFEKCKYDNINKSLGIDEYDKNLRQIDIEREEVLKNISIKYSIIITYKFNNYFRRFKPDNVV